MVKNGKFIINFTAIPDLSLDKNTDPVFDYEIEADVTDLNGETRSGNITVPVGYKALNLQINLPKGDLVDVDSFKTISLTSKNLSGEVNPVKADVKIFKLKAPERLIRLRLWAKPDQFIINKNDKSRSCAPGQVRRGGLTAHGFVSGRQPAASSPGCSGVGGRRPGLFL